MWAILFCGAYIWAITSGHDQQIFQIASHFYQKAVDWLEDAEISGIPTKKKTKVVAVPMSISAKSWRRIDVGQR